MKIVDKQCERCGEMLFRVPSIQKYCPTCRKVVDVEQHKASNEKRKKAAKSQTVEKRCEFCGKTFRTSRGNKIFCSFDCCRKAHNAQNAAEGTHILEPPRRMPPPKISADEVTAAANAEGLSYGQYSVKHGLYANVGT